MASQTDRQRGQVSGGALLSTLLTLLAVASVVAVIVAIVRSANAPVAESRPIPGPGRPGPESSPREPTGSKLPESGGPTDDGDSLHLEAFDEILDPIALGDRQFTVVVHKLRTVRPEAAGHAFDPDDDVTAVSFDVLDGDGTVLYRRSVVDDPREIELERVRQDGRFSFSYSVHAYRLEGSSGRGLMVDWYFFPSAPSACSTHAILGIVGGDLVPFSEPFCEILRSPSDLSATSWRLTRESASGDDVLEVESRVGYFSVIVPVRIDFAAGRLLPSRRCGRLDESSKWVELCEFPVEAHPSPRTERTFARLFPRPDGGAVPRHVVVEPGSTVEFVSALAPNVFDARGEPVAPTADPAFWLRVRIDGREGWVRDSSDLQALGLFAAG